MKKVKLLVGAILFSGIVLGQKIDPKVEESFKTKFPTGKVEEWYEEENEVACDFENNGAYGTAYFQTKGQWLRAEYALDENELPAEVRTSIRSKQPKTEISEATKVEMDDKTYYEVYTFDENSGEYYFFKVDATGKIELHQLVEDTED